MSSSSSYLLKLTQSTVLSSVEFILISSRLNLFVLFVLLEFYLEISDSIFSCTSYYWVCKVFILFSSRLHLNGRCMTCSALHTCSLSFWIKASYSSFYLTVIWSSRIKSSLSFMAMTRLVVWFWLYDLIQKQLSSSLKPVLLLYTSNSNNWF